MLTAMELIDIRRRERLPESLRAMEQTILETNSSSDILQVRWMLQPYMIIFVDEIVDHFESNGFEVFVKPLEVETSTPHHPEGELLLRTEIIVKWE